MTNELSTTNILSLFETTKEQRESFAADLVSRIEDGQADPLQVHLQLKCMEQVLKLVNDNTNYKAMLMDAAAKQGQKSFQFHNAKFEVKEVGTKYDWTRCEDQSLQAMIAEADTLAAKIKARQDMLKTVPLSGMTLVDHETGEAYTVYPPAKTSTTSIAVTLK